jgi:hypothetical protein
VFVRYLCGCIAWSKGTNQIRMYVCNEKVHSGSYSSMSENEVGTFLHHIRGIISAACSAQYHVNQLEKK